MADTPVSTSQKAMKPAAVRRFYREVTIVPARASEPAGYAVQLDGRTARTPAKRPLVVASRALAEALAGEWRAQGETIEPVTMPLTRLVHVALDAAGSEAEVRQAIVRYAGSDLLCYRAGEPPGLVARQAAQWDPVLAWARERIGLRFILSEGVMFVDQPPETVEVTARAVAAFDGPALAALHVMTTLSGSVLLALAVAHGHLSVDAAWAAAHVDEDWNREQWGEDGEATARREQRFADMRAAARVVTELA